MIQNIEKYLDALFSAHASVSSLEEALNTVKSNAELKEIFNDPNVTLEAKLLRLISHNSTSKTMLQRQQLPA